MSRNRLDGSLNIERLLLSRELREKCVLLETSLDTTFDENRLDTFNLSNEESDLCSELVAGDRPQNRHFFCDSVSECHWRARTSTEVQERRLADPFPSSANLPTVRD